MARKKREPCQWGCGKKVVVGHFDKHKPYCPRRPSGTDSSAGEGELVGGLAQSTPDSSPVGAGVEGAQTGAQAGGAQGGLSQGSGKAGENKGETGGSSGQLAGDVPSPQDAQIQIVNPPPVVQKKPDSPKQETPAPQRKSSPKDEPVTKQEWEDWIAELTIQGGARVDALAGEVIPEIAGVWKFEDDEVRLPAKILARKIQRADISTKEAENIVLGLSTLFTLTPRVGLTAWGVYKTVRKVKDRTPPQAAQQTQEPPQREEDDLEKMRKEAAAQWAAKN